MGDKSICLLPRSCLNLLLFWWAQPTIFPEWQLPLPLRVHPQLSSLHNPSTFANHVSNFMVASTVFCEFCLWTLTLLLHMYTELFPLESQMRRGSENPPYLYVSYNVDTLIILTTCHTSIHCFFIVLPFPPIDHPLLRCRDAHTPSPITREQHSQLNWFW